MKNCLNPLMEAAIRRGIFGGISLTKLNAADSSKLRKSGVIGARNSLENRAKFYSGRGLKQNFNVATRNDKARAAARKMKKAGASDSEIVQKMKEIRNQNDVVNVKRKKKVSSGDKSSGIVFNPNSSSNNSSMIPMAAALGGGAVGGIALGSMMSGNNN